MKKLFSFCVGLVLILTTNAYAQSTITGTVKNSKGEALTGVSVKVKNASVGAATDQNGKFAIKLPKDANQLVFSSIGFTSQELVVGTQKVLNIILQEDVSALSDVVVVGYGTQSRRNVTSSIAKLDQQVLANTPRSNFGAALQGTMPGLQVVNTSGQPGASPLIILRGGASINSPGAPLVVVDGIIRSYNDISTEDIASVELLKDAAATAIYGARASNGVILITTKQGKAGTAQISYKFTAGQNQKRDGYKFLNSKDYIYYNRLGNLNSGRPVATVNAVRGYGFLTDTAAFDVRQYGPTTAYLLGKGWDTVGDPYGGTIIFKDHGGEIENILLRTTQTQDHYISASGGNDKGKYFASFDYYNEDGVVVGAGYKRYSADINGSYKVRSNVEISTGANFSTASQLGLATTEVNTFYRTLDLWPTFNPWLDSAKTQPNPGIAASGSDGNPLYWLNKTQRRNETNRITLNGSVKWDLTPNFYIKGTAAGYYYENFDEQFTQATQLLANILANPQTYNSTARPSYESLSRSFQVQYNAIANYSKKFLDKHSVNAMVGAEFFGTKANDMQVSGTLAPTDDIPTVNASTSFVAGSNYSTRSEYRIASTFGRLNYDFDQKYLLSLVMRRDGVSSLSEANRYGYFPGMSAGWNVHREAFFDKLGLSNFITTLKPRFSYGQNGNVSGLGRYEVQGAYGSAGSLYNGSATFLNTGIINTGLRWEKSETKDAGLDLGLFKNKVTIIFDYFDRINSDLLTSLGLPNYTGFSSVKTNLGSYQNKGYEIGINATLINKPNGLKIDVGANASFVKNKIVKLPDNGNENNRQGGLQIYDPIAGKVVWVGGLQEGGTLGDLYAYKQVSIFKDDADVAARANNRYDAIALIGGPGTSAVNKITPGDVNWLDVDKNDTIDSRDQIKVGNIFPKWTGGFNLNIAYKGFSIYSRFEYALGHTIYNDLLARTLGNFNGTFNYYDIQKRAWSPTNTVTDIPKVYYADQTAAPSGKKNYTRNNAGSTLLINGNNSQYYEKGDYLALREITFSYDFPKSLLAKTKYISSMRAYISGSNLVYFTNFTGPTPEPPVASGAVTGMYLGTYPTPRSYVLGVSVSF